MKHSGNLVVSYAQQTGSDKMHLGLQGGRQQYCEHKLKNYKTRIKRFE